MRNNTRERGRLTAGFLQNNNSFCAVAICCWSMYGVVASAGASGWPGWMIPVLSRTRAMDAMMLRFGSQARKPHSSSRLKPLSQQISHPIALI